MGVTFRIVRAILLLVLIVPSSGSYAQTYSFDHLSVSEGLPSPEIYDIFQDRNGFVWIASDNGVARYDGNRMKLFQPVDGLTDPVVFGVIQDAIGRVWFRTYSGKLCYYENGRIKPYPFNHLIEPYCNKSLLQSLYVDAYDRVTFGTTTALGTIDHFGVLSIKPITNYQMMASQVEDQVLHAYPWPHQFIDGIRMGDKTFLWEVPDRTSSYVLNVPLIKVDDAVLIGVGLKVYKIQNDQITTVFQGTHSVISLSVDNQKNVWIGCLKNGVYKASGSDFKELSQFDFLKDKSVTRVLHDHQGGLWFSTLEDGIYHVSDLRISSFKMPVASRVKAVAACDQEAVIGFEGGGAYLLNTSDFKFSQLAGPSRSPLLDVFVDSKKRIWLSADKIQVYESHHLVKSIDNPPNYFFESETGIWALGRVSLRRFVNYERADNFFIPGINRRGLTYDSLVVLIGRTGMNVYNQGMSRKYFSDLFNNTRISQILPLDGDKMVVATMGNGIYVVDKLTWGKSFFLNLQMMGNNVYSLSRIEGDLWMSTEKGIAIVSVKSLLNKSLSFELLTNLNNNLRNKFNHILFVNPYVIVFAENNMYVIPKGIKVMNEPIFSLESVVMNDAPASLQSIRKLEFNQNNLQFNFNYASFNNQNVFARYRLHPLSAWRSIFNQTLTLSSLAPGNYQLEIEYSIDNYNWKRGTQASFQISQPWWLKGQFLLGVFLVIVLVLIFFTQRRITRLREQERFDRTIREYRQQLITVEMETLERDRARIARDLHDSIGCSLAALKFTAAALARKYDDPVVAKLEGDLHDSIKEIRLIIRGMTPAGIETSRLVTVLAHYVERMTLGTVMQCEVRASGEEFHDRLISLSVFRIIQELFSNTLKYAQASKVVIQLHYTEHNLKVTYEDDGTGFNISQVQPGFGIASIESRVKALEATIRFQSHQGVQYEIDIPYKTQVMD